MAKGPLQQVGSLRRFGATEQLTRFSQNIKELLLISPTMRIATTTTQVSGHDHCSLCFRLTQTTANERMETGEETGGNLGTSKDSALCIGMGADFPTAIPDPYPTALPPEMEVADTYYVVDRGREVGIFTDKYVVSTPHSIALTFAISVLSTGSITGVPHGHQVKVKTWYEAATLYNSLWDKGLVARVRL